MGQRDSAFAGAQGTACYLLAQHIIIQNVTDLFSCSKLRKQFEFQIRGDSATRNQFGANGAILHNQVHANMNQIIEYPLGPSPAETNLCTCEIV